MMKTAPFARVWVALALLLLVVAAAVRGQADAEAPAPVQAEAEEDVLPNQHVCPADEEYKNEKAKEFRSDNNLAMAMICFEERLAHSPDDLEALYGKSELFFAMGNLSEAELRIREVVHKYPRHVDSIMLLADILRVRDEQKRYGKGEHNYYKKLEMNAETMNLYKEAVEIDPTEPIPWAAYGSYFLSLEDFEGAITVFGDGLEALGEKDRYLMLIGLAEANRHMEQHASCITYAQQALVLDRVDARAYGILGACALFANEPEKAVRALAKACQLDPQEPGHAHYLIMALRSNTAMEPAALLHEVSRLDIHKYDEFVIEAFDEFVHETKQRMQREEEL